MHSSRVVGSLVLLGLSSLFISTTYGQSVQTVAGGVIGDERPATRASIILPKKIAYDSNGNLYVADYAQDRVRRIDASTGTITTLAGNGETGVSGDGGVATLASLTRPVAVRVDSDGNVFIADRSERIRRVDAVTGIITTVVGTGTQGFSGDGGPATLAMVARPTSIAFDASDNLFFVDRLNSRVRRVDRETGVITTVAGNGQEGFSGDGGPATQARLGFRYDGYKTHFGDVEVDQAGNLFIADAYNFRIRKVDANTQVISTVVGGGGSQGDNVPATQARLEVINDIALTPNGSIVMTEDSFNRVRFVDATSGLLTTIANVNGEFAGGFGGDGGPAVDATLENPVGVAIAPNLDIAIADEQNNRVRLIDGQGIIDTIAGGFLGDGLVAKEVSMLSPDGVLIDTSGGLIFSDNTAHNIRRVDPVTNRVFAIAGTGQPGFSGDDGPAVDAQLSFPGPIALDSQGSLYIGDLENVRIRKVDPAGIITTYAGTGDSSPSGDGGPATQASFGFVFGLAVDGADNLYAAIFDDHVVRRIDSRTGIMTTVAGNGQEGFGGDGGPATQARLAYPVDVATDHAGNLYIADGDNRRLRRVDAVTGIIQTIRQGSIDYVRVGPDGRVYINEDDQLRRIDPDGSNEELLAGTGFAGYSGDGGPALNAAMSPAGLFVDDALNLWFADRGRIRAVFACVAVDTPRLIAPVENEFVSTEAATLSWDRTPGAFSWDLYLDTKQSPGVLVATDLSSPSFTLGNLEPGTTYYWRVEAKGDPFCVPSSSALSAVRSFTTTPRCVAPGTPAIIEPSEGLLVEPGSIRLRWKPMSGVSSYDVYLGAGDSLPLYGSTTNSFLDVQHLIPGQTYEWFVVARAFCNVALQTASDSSNFVVDGGCGATSAPVLASPGNGVPGVGLSVDLTWQTSNNASSYTVFFGSENPPGLIAETGSPAPLRVSGLERGTTYYWQVRANVDCDEALSRLSSVSSFTTTSECTEAEPVRFETFPSRPVALGKTYTITWGASRDLDPDGTYIVERSSDPTFRTVIDAQETSTTGVTFVASATGPVFHRVRPVPSCERSAPLDSEGRVVEIEVVGAERPAISFSLEPESIIAPVGTRIEDLRTRFALENLAAEPVDVSVTATRIDSIPFFEIRDPLGADPRSVTLEPGVPRLFEIRFTGPPNDEESSYQGLVVVTTPDSAVASYAYVNLRIGEATDATPLIRVNGVASNFGYFPPFAGDDTEREPITIEIHNPGSEPMALSAEIGPELWLEPESGWNEPPLPPGGTRSVELFSRRKLAPAGSRLPRYTYFKIGTSGGQQARILVQDNDAIESGSGRSRVGATEVQFVIPEVCSIEGEGEALVSRIVLTNPSTDSAQTSLIFTPTNTDGFDSSVRRASIIVPPNEVIILIDPLAQLFALDRPALGQIAIETSGASGLEVESTLVSDRDVDSARTTIPVFRSDEGASLVESWRVGGLRTIDGELASIVLAETSGRGPVEVELNAYDSDGSLVASSTTTVPRHGHVRVENLLGSSLSSGWVDMKVQSGSGRAAGVLFLSDEEENRSSTYRGSPRVEDAVAKSGGRSLHDEVTQVLVAPYVASGDVEGLGASWTTALGLIAPPGGIEFQVVYTDLAGASIEKTVSLPASNLAGAVIEFDDVLTELFGLDAPVEGALSVIGDPSGSAYGRLESGTGIGFGFDLIPSISELASSASNQQPLVLDGIDQSVSRSAGSIWNLHVKEIGGSGGTFSVRLYESGNRAAPIAKQVFEIPANGQVSLISLFADMGLESDLRQKDRANVLCVVAQENGGSALMATAVEIEARTGRAKLHHLRPLREYAPGLVTDFLVEIVPPGNETARPNRRRPVDRGE